MDSPTLPHPSVAPFQKLSNYEAGVVSPVLPIADTKHKDEAIEVGLANIFFSGVVYNSPLIIPRHC